MSMGTLGLDTDTILRQVLERQNQYEDHLRRLETTLSALIRLESSHSPTDSALTRTPSRAHTATPVEIRAPKPRVVKTPIPAPAADPAEVDILWAASGFVKDPMVGLDADGCIRAWNPAAEAAFGYTAEEVYGKPLPIIPESKREEHQTLLARALAGDTLRDIPAIRRRKNGSLLDVLVTLSGSGSGVAMLLKPVVTDAPAPASTTDATVGIRRLVAAVVHDLNNFFTVICGGSEGLVERLTVGDPRRTDAEMVHSAAVHAARIVQQLSLITDPQSQVLAVADLHMVAREMEPVLRGLVGPNIDLILVNNPEGRATVKVDAARLSQVFLNLVANARDAMPDGGILTVTATQDAEGSPVLSVSDTGCGIDESTIDRIFDNHYSTKAKGRGIGLTTVQDVVLLANGRIEVESQLGLGTTFRITFQKMS